MYPPIFQLCKANADVTVIFGVSPVRIYPFGSAPEDVSTPYAVWRIIGGLPDSYLSGTPDTDSYLVQIDVYATSCTGARDGAEAIRDALEPSANVISWRGESQDNETKLYNYEFDVNFIVERG